MSRRNRENIPVRTYDGRPGFHVSQSTADRMLLNREAFILIDSPRELQLLHGPRLHELGKPDLSLIMPPTVIHAAAVGSEHCQSLVEAYARNHFAGVGVGREENKEV